MARRDAVLIDAAGRPHPGNGKHKSLLKIISSM
jgi:hypothetical protein